MGMVRSALAATAGVCLVLLAGCGGGAPTASEPRSTPATAAPSAATGSPSGSDSPGEPDGRGSAGADRERTGAAARVPRAVIVELLRDSAERIAQRLAEKSPPVLPTDIDPDTNRGLGYQLMLDFGFAADQWRYLDALWQRESGWNHLAENPSSGAYGIPQSLPGSKMAVIAADWRTNPQTQIQWGLAYISARYGDPEGAWAHSESFGWY